MDTTAYVIWYMLEGACGEKIYAPECLTFRPFFRKLAQREERRFVKPYVSITEGFNSFLTLFGGLEKCIRILPDTASLFDSFHQKDFKANPVIISPLCKRKMWNRVDTLFYDNKSYFITVLDKRKDKLFFHDPEGIPCCMIDEELLRECMYQTGEDILSIEIGRAEYTDKLKAGFWEDFLFMLKKFCIQVQQDSMSGGDAWKSFRLLLEGDFPSSAQMCLYYNIMEIQQNCQSIREFFSLNPFIQIEKERHSLLDQYIQQYECCCADIMEGLLNRNIRSIKSYIENVMYIEKELLTLYLML